MRRCAHSTHSTHYTPQVLLLLESQARGSSLAPRQPLRPSRLVLHSNGHVTFVPGGYAGGGSKARSVPSSAYASGKAQALSSTTLASEEELYCSPEELEGRGGGPQSEVFRCGRSELLATFGWLMTLNTNKEMT